MTYPHDVGVVDTMIGFPLSAGDTGTYDFLRPLLRDEESVRAFDMPAQYMFKNIPDPVLAGDPAAALIAEMDRFGIEVAMVGVDFDRPETIEAVRNNRDRIVGCVNLAPHEGMKGVDRIVRAREEIGVVAAATFPAGEFPQIPINDKAYYPSYAKCAELGLPVFICAGTPGPRIPLAPQKVELLDEVCWYFPELTIVTRHGCMPDIELAVQLLLKWPNLHYSTSAMAPKHYPQAIVDFANTRGRDKII